MPFELVRDEHTAPFFDALTGGRLLLRRDPATGTWFAPVATGPGLEWAESRGTGTVESWAVVHLREGEPLLVGIVELDEGPWLRTRLVGVTPDEVRDGLPVRVRPLVPDEGSEPLPAFAPV